MSTHEHTYDDTPHKHTHTDTHTQKQVCTHENMAFTYYAQASAQRVEKRKTVHEFKVQKKNRRIILRILYRKINQCIYNHIK